MMVSAILAVQRGIVAAVRTASPSIAPIYDQAPAGARFPYITFGPSSETPEDAEGCPAVEIVMQLDVWSDAPGKPEAVYIAARLCGLLDGAALVLDAFAPAELHLERRRVLSEPGTGITHVVLSFRTVVEEGSSP